VKRGRPPKDEHDIELVRVVAARARGVNVEQACDEIAASWTEAERLRRGYDKDEAECGSQLRKRYERIRREYVPWVPVHPRARLLALIYGTYGTLVRRRYSAFIELRRRPHQKRAKPKVAH
jgi:hypothetical protein